MGNTLARTGERAGLEAAKESRAALVEASRYSEKLAERLGIATETVSNGTIRASTEVKEGLQGLGEHVEASSAWFRLGLKDFGHAHLEASNNLSGGMKDVGNGLSILAQAHSSFASEFSRAADIGQTAALLLAHESREWRRNLTYLALAGLVYLSIPVLVHPTAASGALLHPVASLVADPLGLVWKPQAALAVNVAGRYLVEGPRTGNEGSRTINGHWRVSILLVAVVLALLPVLALRTFIILLDLGLLSLFAGSFILDRGLEYFSPNPRNIGFEGMVTEKTVDLGLAIIGLAKEGVAPLWRPERLRIVMEARNDEDR